MFGKHLMLVLIAALGGCMIAEPFEKPEIVAGGESTVTIRTGSIRSAQTTAERHCRRFRKRAKLTDQAVLEKRAITYYTFDCVSASPEVH